MKEIIAKIDCDETYCKGCELRLFFAHTGWHLCRVFGIYLFVVSLGILRCDPCLESEAKLSSIRRRKKFSK